MLIVGGGAALTAIAAWIAWLLARSLRASWRERAQAGRADPRQDARRHEARTAHLAPGE
ncbi:MAG: hypothetical protein ACXW3V_06845 [Methylocystis sp.]